jgi:hypothetical protein
MTKVLICDPPEGWKYGWPKPCPPETIGSDEHFRQYLLAGGYPEALIELAMKHSRYWEHDDERN